MTAPSRHVWALPRAKKFEIARDGCVLSIVFALWAFGGLCFDWYYRMGHDVIGVYHQWGKQDGLDGSGYWNQGRAFMPAETYNATDDKIEFYWGAKDKKEWPFGKYSPFMDGTYVNKNGDNKFAVRWVGRIHLANLPATVSRISFTILSDAKEIQFGRVTETGARDRWIARPPLMPSTKCSLTEAEISVSNDTRDLPCPSQCMPVKVTEAERGNKGQRMSNLDTSPTLHLRNGQNIVDTTCDRYLDADSPDHRYLDFELNYTSTGIFPYVVLKWEGDGLPYQTVDGSYFYEYPDGKSFVDQLKAFDINRRTATVIGVCLMLATMWFVGEVLFLTKKEKDSQNAKSEKAQIEKKNQNKTRDYEQESPEGLLMVSRAKSSYPNEWATAVSKWNLRKKKHEEAMKTSGYLRGIIFYCVYFVVGNTVVAFFLMLVPPSPSPSETHSSLQLAEFYLNPFGDLSKYGVYDFICFGALLLETLLFVWAILEVEWPPRGSKSSVLDVLSSQELDVMNQGGQQVALLLASHCCDQSLEKREGLTQALHAALEVFPPSSIFICDNARSPAPPDDTWRLIDDIWHDYNSNAAENSSRYQEPFNYTYLPVGNKTIAFFWVCDVWIPMLERNKLCPKFEYILMTDDDVCLPRTIQFPLKMMEMEKDVQAIAYAISAIDISAAAHDPRLYLENMLVSYQNLEYLLAGFFKQLQSGYGTTLACHGAIALWKRDILVSKIFWDHDCIFNGEDLQMGLILHAMKQGHKIRSQPRELVYTAPPDFTLMLWQQRVKSWDVTSHRMTLKFLNILFFQWCGGISTLILKPFFVLEVFNICQDWARIFFFSYLITYREGQIHLMQWVIFLVIVEWILLFIWDAKSLKHRPDLKSPGLIYFLYPLVYKPLTQLFRWYALLENIVRYSPFGPQPFKVRERDELGLLPPVPEFAMSNPHLVDWRTIWTVEEDTSAASEQQQPDVMKNGGKSYMV